MSERENQDKQFSLHAKPLNEQTTALMIKILRNSN